MRPFGFGNRADRPVRSDPFARGMREHGCQIDDPGCLVDRSGLHGGDLILAQSLAHDLEPAGKRRIAELPCAALTASRLNRTDQRLLRIREFDLALASALASAAIDGLDRCMARLLIRSGQKVEADGAGFGALGAHPMADRLPGIFRD